MEEGSVMAEKTREPIDDDDWVPSGAVAEEDWEPAGAVPDAEVREDFGDAGATTRAPEPPGPESISEEPYGPPTRPPQEPVQILGVPFPSAETARGAVASFLQGPTFNWADEMAGMQAKQKAAIHNIGKPESEWEDPEEAYSKGRGAFRGAEETFREEHPVAGLGLTVLGGAAVPASVGPALASRLPRALWSVLGPGASTGARTATAGVLGATAGAGAAEEAEDMALGAALGAPLGAGAQMLGRATGSTLGSVARRGAAWLQGASGRAAEERAVKAATGQNKRVLRSMVQRGLLDSDTGTIEAVGRDLLETGTVTAGTSTREIMDRAAAGVQTAGRGIDDALEELDATTPQGLRLSADAVADEAEQALILPLLQGTHGQKQLAQRLAPEIDALRAQGTGEAGEVSLSALEQFKRGLDDAIGPGGWTATEPRPVTEALRQLRGIVNDAIETRAGEIGRETGSDAAERYLANKRIYGSLRVARDAARDQVSGQISNRLVSVTDYASGPSGILLAGMASGGDPLMSAAGGAAAAGINKLARARGNQVAAAGLDRLSGSDWLDELARTNPEALGRWGAYLGAAASRSPEALSAAKYELGQLDPEYQEERRRQGGQQP